MGKETKKKKLVIEWPTTAFTINDIKDMHPDAKEITLRFRINKAIEEGELVYIGKIPRKVGRPHIAFAQSPVKSEVLQSAQVERGIIVDEEFEQLLVDVVKVGPTTETSAVPSQTSVTQNV